jgi:hypothetical protein
MVSNLRSFCLSLPGAGITPKRYLVLNGFKAEKELPKNVYSSTLSPKIELMTREIVRISHYL